MSTAGGSWRRNGLYFMNVTLQRGDREPEPEPESLLSADFSHVTFSLVHRLPSSLSDYLLEVTATGYRSLLPSVNWRISHSLPVCPAWRSSCPVVPSRWCPARHTRDTPCLWCVCLSRRWWSAAWSTRGTRSTGRKSETASETRR